MAVHDAGKAEEGHTIRVYHGMKREGEKGGWENQGDCSLIDQGDRSKPGTNGWCFGDHQQAPGRDGKTARQADREHTKQAGRLGLLTTGDMGKDISREARQRGQVATAAGKSDTAGHEDTHPPTSKSNSYAQKRGAAQQRSWGHIAAHAVQGFCNPLAVGTDLLAHPSRCASHRSNHPWCRWPRHTELAHCRRAARSA